jgi:hypothetical protein
MWASKIIDFLKNEIQWKYENTFRFSADLTITGNGKSVVTLPLKIILNQ